MRVKICGITGQDAAAAAAAAGADAVGCLVGLDGPARDAVDARAARAIFASLPPFVARVLVTHRREVADIAALVRDAGPTVVQLHGALPLDAIAALRSSFPFLGIVKTVHVVDASAVGDAARAAEAADAVLLDSRTADRIGGTGTIHDWSISARIVRESNRPVILAGGLTPRNVAEAVRQVRPWGVDVNSGTRGPDGAKSEDLMRAFVTAARGALQSSPSGPIL